MIADTPEATKRNNHSLTDAERADRNARILADAPNMTVRELEAKHGVCFTGIGCILKAAGVTCKGGRSVKKCFKSRGGRKIRRPEMTHLECSKCAVTKPVAEFYDKGWRCRACAVLDVKKWGEENPEAVKAAKKKHREENRDGINAKHRELYNEDIEASRAESRADYKKNSKRKMGYSMACAKRRMKKDPKFRMIVRQRQRIWRLLQGVGKKKGSRTELLIGMKYAEFVSYIESLWLPGMSWENYSWRGWHVDHIKPCASFDLADPEQMKKCFHWSNMRPLWAVDNWAKGDKIIS